MKKLIILLLSGAAMYAQEPTKRIEFEAEGSYPEGVAFDKATNVFYVSSARLGTVGKVTKDGKYTELYADTSLKSTYGVKVHPNGKWLFVCAGDANYSIFGTPASKKKEARLLSIDLKSGKKLADVDLSKLIPGEHFPNDIAFDDKGNAYVTDSFADAVYKVDASGKASIFSQHELLKSAGVGPNGIVFNPAGFLLVANNGKGCLVKIDIKNPATADKVSIDQFFPSADGMLLNDNSTLTLVQNGGDTLQYRLDKAKATAHCETILWEDGPKGVVEQIRAITQGRGADVCVDAVGFEPERSFIDKAKAVVNLEKGSVKVLEACMSAVRRGGIVSVLGVYPTTYDNFPVGQFFDKGIIMRGGQAPAHKHIDKLLGYVTEGKVTLDDIITHRLPLTEIAHGYDIFNKKEDGCVKVVLDPWA